jgi:thioredoxin-like negative regulator of GroEL
MNIRRLAVLFLGLTLGLLLLTAPYATRAQAAGNPVIIEFRSAICPYCYQMAEILGELERQYPGQFTVQFYTMETDEPMFKKYRVSIVPTLVVLGSSGSVIYQHEGAVSKEALVSTLKGLNIIRN